VRAENAPVIETSVETWDFVLPDGRDFVGSSVWSLARDVPTQRSLEHSHF
jgi:hypothetical protein